MPAEVLIPFRFYGYDSLIYLLVAAIGFLISYKAYRISEITKERTHRYLFLGFIILTIGMLTLSLTSGYSYLRYFADQEFIKFDQFFGIDDLGLWIYFILSFISYIFLVLIYLPKDKAKFLIALPISFNYYIYFNVILVMLISYVALRSAMNYLSKRSTSSLLVFAGFGLILLYHGLLLFTFVHRLVYVAAHISLILGFIALLAMLFKTRV